jgi:hypothetical protein
MPDLGVDRSPCLNNGEQSNIKEFHVDLIDGHGQFL